MQFYLVFTHTEAFRSDSQILVFLNLFWHIFATHIGRRATSRSVFPLILGGKRVWLKLEKSSVRMVCRGDEAEEDEAS